MVWGVELNAETFLVDQSMARGAFRHVQVNLVQAATQFDGDPGGSGLGGCHG